MSCAKCEAARRALAKRLAALKKLVKREKPERKK
jgi:hypothetical protein